ncbi:MAG: CvpA family protein [Candidatus Kerfeldbacteria bacterium]|nr:CvpA family protein [Candidatus Kerfeldbacteria bacterium]
MSWLDWLLLLTLFSFVWGGFWTGLIQSIGGVVGLLVGVIVASHYADQFGQVLTPVFAGQEVWASIAAFFLLFLLVTRLIGLLFVLVNRIFNLVAIVPGMKLVNRLGGAAFGFLEGALFLGVMLQYAVRLPLGPRLSEAIAESSWAKMLMTVAAWLVPLFPPALKGAEKAIDRFLPR